MHPYNNNLQPSSNQESPGSSSCTSERRRLNQSRSTMSMYAGDENYPSSMSIPCPPSGSGTSPRSQPVAVTRRRQSPLERPTMVQGGSKRLSPSEIFMSRHSCTSGTLVAQATQTHDCVQQPTAGASSYQPSMPSLSPRHNPIMTSPSRHNPASCSTYTISKSASNAPPSIQHRYQPACSPRRSPQSVGPVYPSGAGQLDGDHLVVCTTSQTSHIVRVPESLSSSTSSSASGSTGGANMMTDITQHYTAMCRQFEQMYVSNTLCDVTLRAADSTNGVPCHRVVLAAASTYFSAMFTAGMAESRMQEIVIHEVEADALAQLIHFCYTGGVHLDETNVEHVLSGACLLQLEPVVGMCTQFLTNQLHQSNCLGIRSFADRLGTCLRLRRAAELYAMEHFEQVMEQHEFVELPLDQVEALLQSDELNVSSELAVLYALCRWISRSPRTRAGDAARLLNCVRLIYLSPEHISDHIEGNPLFASGVCRKYVLHALKYHLLPNRRAELMTMGSSACSTSSTSASTTSLYSPTPSTPMRPRPSTVGAIYAIGGSDANRSALSIEQYDNRSDTWHVIGRLPSRRLQFGCAVMHGLVYIVGGRDGLKTLSSFECWNPINNEWTVMPSMMTPRHGLSVAFVEGPLYACGGHDGWAYLSSVERWDPGTQTWSYVAEMNKARNMAGVAVIGTRLYCVGGRDSSQVLRCVECYNPHTNKWTLVASMNRRRSGVGVGVLNGCIYAVGGMDAPPSNPQSARFASVERYDPRTDEWTAVASLSLGRDGVGLCTIGDRLMAVGGCHNGMCVNLVEVYDEDSNLWSQVCPLQTGRAGTQVVVVPTRSINFNFTHLPIFTSLTLTPASTTDDEATDGVIQSKISVLRKPEPLGPKPRLPVERPPGAPTTTQPSSSAADSLNRTTIPPSIPTTESSPMRATLVVRCQSPVDVDKHSYSI